MPPKSKPLRLAILWLAASAIVYLFTTFIGRVTEFDRANRVSSEHALQRGQTTDLGALVAAPEHLSIKIRIHFRVDAARDPISFPNLFQTDDANSGIRVELAGATLAAIVARHGDSPRGILLTHRLMPETDYLLELVAETNSGVWISLNGKTVEVADRNISFSLRHFRVGAGFDDSRTFVGPIEKWELLYSNRPAGLREYLNTFSLISLLAATILLSGRFVLAWMPWQGWLSRRQPAIRLQEVYQWVGSALSTPSYRRMAAILAAASPIFGVIYIVASSELAKSAVALRSKLLPGMLIEPGAALFKDELVVFAIVQFGLGLVISASFLLGHKSTQRRLDVGKRTISLILLLDLAAILTSLLIGPVSRFAFALIGLSIVLTASLLIRGAYSGTAKTRANISSAEFLTPDAEGKRFPLRRAADRAVAVGERYRWPLLACLSLVCATLSVPLFSAWFPLTMPNDYMELSDTFRGDPSTSGGPLSRSQVIACLAALDAKGTPEPYCEGKREGFDEELSEALASSGGWQGEPGRTLFHHSYVYVPAAHLLKYGFDRNLPYLYGFGNTAAHALLMWLAGGATLSNYFNTVPAAELLGLLSIAAVVLYATRSALPALLSYLIALACLYGVNFTAVFLAISFSPLRYFGLIVQIASIIFVARNSTRPSALVLICAACFSLFWNREFAILGMLGQGLWTLSFHPMRIRDRAITIIGMLALLVAGSILSASTDSISTVTLAFYNVWNPVMSPSKKATFILLLVGGQICLICLARLASSDMKAALLSITPVIGCLFVKYAFNPSPPHLSFVFILAASTVVMFIPWTRIAPLSRAMLLTPAFVVVIAYTASVSSEYLKESDSDRRTLMRPFVSEPWSRLGETIRFVAPEADIFRRVSAIKALTARFDRVLWLSPFDHVLSFYVNPPMVCGHFEVMTNVATPELQAQLASCGARPGTLVVYDKAITAPCPTNRIESGSRCSARAAMKSNLNDIMQSLSPRVQRIAETSDLIFYSAR
jgi:hypothetical protein